MKSVCPWTASLYTRSPLLPTLFSSCILSFNSLTLIKKDSPTKGLLIIKLVVQSLTTALLCECFPCLLSCFLSRSPSFLSDLFTSLSSISFFPLFLPFHTRHIIHVSALQASSEVVHSIPFHLHANGVQALKLAFVLLSRE